MPGPRLPAVAGDIGTWGTVLNAYLAAANPVFNVKLDPYGAVGDGAADDTAEIQAAIDAANASDGHAFVPPGTYVTSGTLTIPAGVNLFGLFPETTIIYYSGTGTAVKMTGRGPGLRGIKVATSNAGASVVGVMVDATAASSSYWKLRDVLLSADTKTAGQAGLKIQNAVTTSTRYGSIIGLDAENWGTGVKYVTDNTLAQNSNRATSVHLRNCDTCLDLGDTYENIWGDLICDTFNVAINIDGGQRNFITCHSEGGAGAQGYTLGAASAENWIVINDDNPDASTDAGTRNWISCLGVAQRKAWDSRFATVASAATIAIPNKVDVVSVTGTTTITSVTAGYAGQKVTLVFAGVLTFTDGSNLKLAGNLVTTADDSISLVCDGTNWIETGRSVN